MEIATWTLRLYTGCLFMMGIQFACQQTFVALGQAKISLFLALLRKIILLIPLIYILPNFFNDKVFAVFLAEPVADFLAAATPGRCFSSPCPASSAAGRSSWGIPGSQVLEQMFDKRTGI